MNQNIKRKINPIFKKYGIRRAALFGSFARGVYTKKSDIDLLVFLGKPMGAFTYTRMIHELKTALGRNVDVITDKSINPHIKPYIMEDVVTVYEK